jgi:hypothetical protein
MEVEERREERREADVVESGLYIKLRGLFFNL